ncbi:hypothetical protein TNCV_2678261 [Trichonephila clavipes]|nr:hypothetical protein TNCV_2678261 [Trichonephila clavipes]
MRNFIIVQKCFIISSQIDIAAAEIEWTWLRRGLKPLKTHHVEELMHAKCVEAQSPPVGKVWKFGEGKAISGVVLVT